MPRRIEETMAEEPSQSLAHGRVLEAPFFEKSGSRLTGVKLRRAPPVQRGSVRIQAIHRGQRQPHLVRNTDVPEDSERRAGEPPAGIDGDTARSVRLESPIREQSLESGNRVCPREVLRHPWGGCRAQDIVPLSVPGRQWPQTRIQTLERIGQQISIRVGGPGKNVLALLKQVRQGEAGGHLPKGAVGRSLQLSRRKQRRFISPSVQRSIVPEKMIDRSFQSSSPLPVGLPGYRSKRGAQRQELVVRSPGKRRQGFQLGDSLGIQCAMGSLDVHRQEVEPGRQAPTLGRGLRGTHVPMLDLKKGLRVFEHWKFRIQVRSRELRGAPSGILVLASSKLRQEAIGLFSERIEG